MGIENHRLRRPFLGEVTEIDCVTALSTYVIETIAKRYLLLFGIALELQFPRILQCSG